jgi:hypothetical protein
MCLDLVDYSRVTLVLYRRRAFRRRLEVRRALRRAFDKAVRRKPLARRTRSLCKLNGVEGAFELRG